ncbi:MAG: acyl-CoA dehydrogenase, partial [Proteobacteria bacterium]|nr:acyl-CoA dehydrogenase [Pseudomonadota bacterium]
MDVVLNDSAKHWQEKAGKFADQELRPWEVEAEMNNGEIPPEIRQRHQQMAIDLGFSKMDVP